jgi:hypothetical protein
MGCFAKWRASFAGVPRRNQVRIAVAMFFTFPQDARWNAERSAVEFGVEIGRTEGWSGSRGAFSNGCLPERPTPYRALRRTTSGKPGSRPLPSGRCAGAG